MEVSKETRTRVGNMLTVSVKDSMLLTNLRSSARRNIEYKF